jgi:alpha-glucosidase
VPIYVRAGAILPTRELEQWVGQLPENPVTINVYPGPDSEYVMYCDDRLTRAAELQGQYRTIRFRHRAIGNGQRITIDRLHDQFNPPEKFYFVALPGTPHPTSVTADGQALQDLEALVPNNHNVDKVETAAKLLLASPVDAYYWNANIEVTFVKLYDNRANRTLDVVL